MRHEFFAPTVHRYHTVIPLVRRASEAGVGMDYTQVAWPHYTGLEPGGHNSEEGARAYIDLLRPGLRVVHSGLTFSSRDQVDNFAGLRHGMENS